MVSSSDKLADALEQLKKLQKGTGAAAIRSKDMPRKIRECLLSHGFLQEVMKGWYIPSRPEEVRGESTAWFAGFWSFSATYLDSRFGKDWCLSPEQSLSLHTGNWRVPEQLLVRSPKARNKVTTLPYHTSLLDIRANMPAPADIEVIEGIRIFSLEAALVTSASGFYRENATDVRASLFLVKDASGILARLLEGGHSSIAGRLAGAFRNIGKTRIADDIVKTMSAAGFTVRENDPFDDKLYHGLNIRNEPSHVTRIKLLWQNMRGPAAEHFPPPQPLRNTIRKYLKDVDDVYITDAYHSLSIEGYLVTPALIQRVRDGKWNPDDNAEDRQQRNAMAARGYWQAFQAVHKSVEDVLKGKCPAQAADEDHGTWYRELFAPSITAGLLRPSDLAGYRNEQVFIRGSMHVPFKHQAVRDMMPSFFELMAAEENPAVRVVLGHFLFVYIHPYSDGNGRIGRFLMNLMLAAGGYPWTVIPVETRQEYMVALEQASVRQDIIPFTRFLAKLVRDSITQQVV